MEKQTLYKIETKEEILFLENAKIETVEVEKEVIERLNTLNRCQDAILWLVVGLVCLGLIYIFFFPSLFLNKGILYIASITFLGYTYYVRREIKSVYLNSFGK